MPTLAPLALALLPVGDLTVGPPGSGRDFTDVQAAVDAAQPGDRVFVYPGDYGPVVLAKPVQLAGAGGDRTRLVAPAGVVPLEIVGNGPQSRTRVTGVELAVAPEVSVPPPAFLRISGNAGRTELHDVKVRRFVHDARAGGGAYFSIEDSGWVYMSTVRMLVQPGPAGTQLGLEPFVGMRVSNTYVTVSDSTIAATPAPTDAAALSVPGAAGIELFGSTLWMALTGVWAGERGGPPSTAPSGDALRAVASEVTLHGGKSNELVGGSAAVDGPSGESLAGRALVLDGASAATYGASVVLVPGDGPSGPAEAIAAAPGATLDARPDRLPSQWVVDPNPPIGELATVIVEGDPFAVHFWWLALDTVAPLQLGGVVGPLLIHPDLVFHHKPVFLNEDGLGSQQAGVPDDPVYGGLAASYQSLEFDGGPFVQLAPPWFATVELP